MKDEKNVMLTISEMSQIHDISRQTLIYYDKINLFRPAFVDENGYRYYSSMQIPLLKEICFLKSIGVKLEDIKETTTGESTDDTMKLLDDQQNKIDEQIGLMQIQKKQIQERVSIYKSASEYSQEFNKPTIEYFPERHAIWIPWTEGVYTRTELHNALLKIWNFTSTFGYLPSRRWGAVLFAEHLESENPLHVAGGCTFVPNDMTITENTLIFPEGKYVCMSKYGMPYEFSHVKKLVRWIYENGYKITGNIYDECIMDAIFYGNDREVDFCQLQIPIAPV
ncbi:MerR family transcriptional regulator [Parasporobacterium paucivorans]|uniref:DNA-binding transcriptional regulator, MerR family n=1 Tax=Parasporobacterium paucivorans DSM 15970 TaxID=1122934 RepID=A0A1M6E537_9FIRM|nr:MerR family transcriptional regulator [Parasporobacterium paucivorans]SHI80480.1 DNA-binding transcriptional regulator, MerR family [Parasporobacterium paucivorans DSM 15970]